ARLGRGGIAALHALDCKTDLAALALDRVKLVDGLPFALEGIDELRLGLRHGSRTKEQSHGERRGADGSKLQLIPLICVCAGRDSVSLAMTTPFRDTATAFDADLDDDDGLGGGGDTPGNTDADLFVR